MECPTCERTTEKIFDYLDDASNALDHWEDICGGEHGNYGCECGACRGANNYDVDHDHDQFVELEASVYHCSNCRKYICADCGGFIEQSYE